MQIQDSAEVSGYILTWQQAYGWGESQAHMFANLVTRCSKSLDVSFSHMAAKAIEQFESSNLATAATWMSNILMLNESEMAMLRESLFGVPPGEYPPPIQPDPGIDNTLPPPPPDPAMKGIIPGMAPPEGEYEDPGPSPITPPAPTTLPATPAPPAPEGDEFVEDQMDSGTQDGQTEAGMPPTELPPNENVDVGEAPNE